MRYPTLEEYNAALEYKKNVTNTLNYGMERREKLLNDLYEAQKFIETLKQCYTQANETIQQYEIYQQVLKEMEEKMSCEFCEKIWNSEEAYEDCFIHPDDALPAIVMKDGKSHLYIPCVDWYYSGAVLQVDHCPKCGRELGSKHDS